jgi:hypothetical protein
MAVQAAAAVISADTLKMHRYVVNPPARQSIDANGYITYAIPATALPFTPLSAFATVNFQGAVTGITPLILSVTGLSSPDIILVVSNPASDPVYVDTDVSFAVLFAGT